MEIRAPSALTVGAYEWDENIVFQKHRCRKKGVDIFQILEVNRASPEHRVFFSKYVILFFILL